jgi:hypothetical protein
MLRSVLLTFRMHRFEVLLAAVLLGLTAISAIVVESHVAAANPSDACWIQHWQFDPNSNQNSACEAQVTNFWVVADEASFVASPLAVSLPFVIGLLLGVPIVGRELELRTAGLAWSLTGRRWRWLLARFLPVLLLGGVGLVVVAWLVADMARVAHPWNYLGPGRLPDLTEIGSEGLPLAARGLMTLGIGLLAGAVLGRTLPAFAIGAIACFVLLFVGVPLLQGFVGERVAVWQDEAAPGLPGAVQPGDQQPSLVVPGLSDTAYRAPDGTIVSLAQASALGSDEWLADHGYVPVWRVAPIESYPTFENADVIASSTIGLACIVLTFPVVSRRRPA